MPQNGLIVSLEMGFNALFELDSFALFKKKMTLTRTVSLLENCGILGHRTFLIMALIILHTITLLSLLRTVP